MRLDVAVPKSAVIEEPFLAIVQVKQPASPPMAVAELEQFPSAAGRMFRPEDGEIVHYRIEVSGVGFQVAPASLSIKLRPKQDSLPIMFEVTALKSGRRSLFVYAYQDDDTLAAQTRISVDATVAVKPG